MEIAKIDNGQVVEYPVSPSACEAAIAAAMPATVTVEQTNEAGEKVLVEIESQREFPLPANLAGLDLSAHGFAVVEPTDPPEVEPGEVAERDGIELVEGVWRWKWIAQPGTAEDLARAKVDALDYLRELRWQKSVGGMTFNGLPIRTDEASRANISGLVALFREDPDKETADFEAQPNVWVTFDRATAVALGVAVGRHVQECFSRQRVLAGLIDAAESFAALAAIDVYAGWPS